MKTYKFSQNGQDIHLKNLNERSEVEDEHFSEAVELVIGPVNDTLCGIGTCTPKYLQFLATPITYLVISSVIALIQGLFFTYSNATLSTVEKNFGLSSKISGFTTTGNDLTQLILSIPLAYIAGKGHRPRWLSFGMILAAAGCFIATIPHFALRNQEHSMRNSSLQMPLCGTNFTATDCDESSESNTNYFVVSLFIIAQMLVGVASLLYYTIGYSYLDEAVSKSKSPFFLSISGGLRLLGPVCGYALAAWSLRIYVEPQMESSLTISRSHPQWIGAWWIGFIIIGTALFSVSWMLMLLPKTLPVTRRRKIKLINEIMASNNNNFLSYINTLRSDKSAKYKEFTSSFLRLMKNRVYRLILINQCLFWFAFFGYLTFKSKYLEHQFRMSAAEANSYIAGVSLAAALIGWIGTGISLSYFKPKPKTVLIYMASLSLISTLCYVIQAYVSCNHEDMADLVDSIDHSKLNMNSPLVSCSLSCHCSREFSPVCDEEHSKMYLNPCFAGCSSFNKTGRSIEFSSCSCVEHSQSKVQSGFCPIECSSFTIYLIISVVAKMAEAASRVPLNMILFRCVEERDKDLGLGIFNAALALAASIPAPPLFGYLIDSTCLFWETSCTGSSNCWLNDIDMFRKYIHGLPAVLLILCFITDLLLLKYRKELRLYSEKCELPTADKEDKT